MDDQQTQLAEALVADAEELRAAFARAAPYTVGLEEELMVLDPSTLALAPYAAELVERAADPRFKLELPAAQVEIALAPAASVPDAVLALREARGDLRRIAEGLAVLGASGVHPTAPGEGVLNDAERYAVTRARYGPIARRQLVFALQVHVAVGEPERALAVYNASRSYLPLLAALAANAPFYEGRDTGLASVRPKLCELLPRQGVPPTLESWEEYAAALRWGAVSGFFSGRGSWWWELRPHPRHGTLEFRVPDAQSTVADAGAVAAVIQALVVWLGERHLAGERLPVHETWRIEENRWAACRDGVAGVMADLDTGEPHAVVGLLDNLLERLRPVSERLGSAAQLAEAERMVRCNGAIAQRQAARDGLDGLAAWLVEKFAA